MYERHFFKDIPLKLWNLRLNVLERMKIFFFTLLFMVLEIWSAVDIDFVETTWLNHLPKLTASYKLEKSKQVIINKKA